MKKIIALNWKDTQTPESSQVLIKTVADMKNIYPEYEWIVFPADDCINTIHTPIPLGSQNNPTTSLPYVLIGHISQRRK